MSGLSEASNTPRAIDLTVDAHARKLRHVSQRGSSPASYCYEVQILLASCCFLGTSITLLLLWTDADTCCRGAWEAYRRAAAPRSR